MNGITEELLSVQRRSKYMYCRNEFVNDSIINQCNMLNASITLSSKLNICAALTYCYNGKNYIIVNDKLSEQKRVFSILHELSHIDLGYIGEKYEKKVLENSTCEIIFNFMCCNWYYNSIFYYN